MEDMCGQGILSNYAEPPVHGVKAFPSVDRVVRSSQSPCCGLQPLSMLFAVAKNRPSSFSLTLLPVVVLAYRKDAIRMVFCTLLLFHLSPRLHNSNPP